MVAVDTSQASASTRSRACPSEDSAKPMSGEALGGADGVIVTSRKIYFSLTLNQLPTRTQQVSEKNLSPIVVV
jgi:hypothetical protein